MTERLYYHDSYLTTFEAIAVERADQGRRVYLDRTAFYPESGGQPSDRGTLNGIPVRDVVDEGERIAHVLTAPLPGDRVEGRIEWERRFDHMQQHSGQHLLSAVLIELFGIPTVSFHLGAETSTIDIAAAGLDAAQIRDAGRRCAELVFANRPLTVTFEEAAEAAPTLRAAAAREGTLRIVSIQDFDRSACGGTHVRATGEIGPVAIRRSERIRGNLRLEFLCGMRAINRARADFEALSRVAAQFSAPLDETPALVEALLKRARDTEKAGRALAGELAALRGRELYAQARPDAAGVRRAWIAQPTGALDDGIRAMASAFIAQSKAVFGAATPDPPSLLVAASPDSGYHAGNLVKAAVAAEGGRGGGSATVAQGSLPDRAALERALCALAREGLLDPSAKL